MHATLPVVTPPAPGIERASIPGSAASPRIQRRIVGLPLLGLQASHFELPQACLADLFEHAGSRTGLLEGRPGLADRRGGDRHALLPGLEDRRLPPLTLPQNLQSGTNRFNIVDRSRLSRPLRGPETGEVTPGLQDRRRSGLMGLRECSLGLLLSFEAPQRARKLSFAPLPCGERAVERVLSGELEGAFVQRGGLLTPPCPGAWPRSGRDDWIFFPI